MTQELHYTSAPRGLRPGSVGFCTVGQTPNLPGPLIERLEGLSGYQQVFPPHDPNAALNPAAYSHLRITVGGRACSVLSRVDFAGLDYSARSNKYAHHIVLDAAERPAGGPAWLLAQPGFLQTSWQGEPRIIPAGRVVPEGDRPPGIALAWGERAGDPGWAGVLAESFLADPRKPSYLLFEPGMQVLPLFVEALALIPPERRWDVELNTYFTQLVQGTSCPWRGVLADSAEAKNAHRMPGALVIDLRRPSGEPRGGDLVQLARTGRRPARTAEPIPKEAPASGRAVRAQPPTTTSEAEYSLSASPPKLPPARSVRELEGFGDERSGLPWGKISAGVAAMLLVALGAVYLTGAFDGVRSAVNVGDLIASFSQEKSKKVEKIEAEKKQADEQEKAHRDAVAKKKEEEDNKRKAIQKMATKAMRETTERIMIAKEKVDQILIKAQAMVGKAAELIPKPKVAPQIEKLVRFFEQLPEIDAQRIQEKKESEVKSIQLPERISSPYEIIHQKIATSEDSKKVRRLNDATELNQLIVGKPPELQIAIPTGPGGALASDPEVATIRFDGTSMSFCWNKAVVSQRGFETIVRDAAIELGLNGKKSCYVLLRDPKPRTVTEGISLKAGPGGQSSKVRPIDFTWADAKSLEDCQWDLVIMDWRIESTLAGKTVAFASDTPSVPRAKVAYDVITRQLINDPMKGELVFTLSIAKEKLTTTIHYRGEITGQRSRIRAEGLIDSLSKQKGRLDNEIGLFRRSPKSKQDEFAAGKLNLELETKKSSVKSIEQEQAKIKRKLDLYQQYQILDQGYLDVGIGLRLSNGKVIEIARLGPRWKPDP